MLVLVVLLVTLQTLLVLVVLLQRLLLGNVLVRFGADDLAASKIEQRERIFVFDCLYL